MAVVLIAVLSLGSLSCGKNSPQQKPAETGETEKPPPQLEKMKKALAELGTMLEKRRSSEAEVPMQAQDKQGGKAQSQQSAAGGGEWRDEMKVVRGLHREWNGLEPEAVAKGMSSATQEALEESLCNLTRAVESRKALEAQLAANQVYRYYIEAAAIFKTGIPANLERVRYHVTEANLQGVKGAWTGAQDEAAKALEIWHRLSYSLQKIERQILNQVEHSLTDVGNVVKEESTVLTSIKTEIALQNLDDLEKKIKSSTTSD